MVTCTAASYQNKGASEVGHNLASSGTYFNNRKHVYINVLQV